MRVREVGTRHDLKLYRLPVKLYGPDLLLPEKRQGARERGAAEWPKGRTHTRGGGWQQDESATRMLESAALHAWE
jgi:hypothetical protein